MTITEFIEDLEKARAKYGDLKLFVARGYQLYPVESLDLFDCRVGYNEHYDEFFESNNAGFISRARQCCSITWTSVTRLFRLLVNGWT